MGKVVDALIDGTPLGKLFFDAIGIDAWWEVSVGKYIREALIPSPADDFGNEAMQQQQMLRSPTEARRSIYGKAMVSGPIVFAEETGKDNEFLHLVIPLAAHPCEEIVAIYFDDEVVYQNGRLDSAYSEHARINIHLGTQTRADSQLLSECEHWTDKHVGLEITYLYVRLKHDPEFYSNGIPNIKALVKGKPLYDPRKDSTAGGAGNHRWDDASTWEWSDNWALCVLDYTRFESGVGALATEIDLASYALAANDSDQLVEYDAKGSTERRYTCNGTFTQSMTPASVLDKLLTAGAGMQTYSSGKYQLFSGVYQGPYVLSIGEGDLAGEVEVRPFTPRAQLCNAVRGTFVDPDNYYQPTDFAPYESAYYRAQDNNEYIDHDIDLPFTQSNYAAQRLAKLYLELNRAGQQVVVPLNMIGLSVSVGQVLQLDLPRLGLKAEYQVMDWSFDFGQPIKVTLRETHPDLFVYDKGSYTGRKLTPVLNLPSSKRVPTVSGVIWLPMGDDANWQGLLTWDAPGGNSAYRYRLEVSDTFGALVYQAAVDGTRHHIPKLDAGNYTITLWAINLFANRSNVPVAIAIGADAPPAITGIVVDAGALELTLRPQTAAVTATTTVFEVKGGLSSDIANAVFIGQGKEVIWPGRHANTQYFVWARATNNYGFSPWFGPVIAHTSSDNSAIVDLIGATFDSYTWFAWADDNQGTGFTTVEAIGDGKAYMGIATDKKVASPSGNWQEYTWTKIKPEIPPVFTPDEEAKLDNLMAGRFPNDASKEMLALQDALNNPQLSNDLLNAQKLLNQGINASNLGGETPSGAQAKADAAKLQAIGDVAAGNFLAQSALIDTLFASSALFNQLQARFAVFGGLAANSIAAKAITVDKLDVMARNLVNNVSQTGERTGWSQGSVVSHTHKGKQTKALEVVSTGNTQIFGDLFDIDHTKIYEVNFTIHRVSGGTVGTRYLGLSVDGNGYVTNIYPDTRQLGGVTSNFYFWYGDIADGEYHQMRAYVVGSEVDPVSIPDSLNVKACCLLNPSTTQIRLRALNYYNDGNKSVDRWLNMSVTELGGGQISANQLLANSGLFNALKAKIASFGGLTATEIKADTALINKLVGTSALFNDLVARLAVFGGLTANSIASDAILGRHIRAGEKLESPIIEGGELRLIGTSYMKVQAATPFGPDSLVEWYGPKLLSGSNPNWAALRKSNAITYLAANGDAYFGGSLSAGVLKTGVSNSDKNPYSLNTYPVAIGPFSTNGKRKTVVVSFDLFGNGSLSTNPGTPANPYLKWQLERRLGTGGWAVVTSGTFNGNVSVMQVPGDSRYHFNEVCTGSATYTDNSTSTADFTYRVKVTGYRRFSATALVSGQLMTVISTEQ